MSSYYYAVINKGLSHRDNSHAALVVHRLCRGGNVRNMSKSRRAPLAYPTLYASPLITLTKQGYTKHYFEDGRRICSKIGGGFKRNVPEDSITAPVPELNYHYDELWLSQNEGILRTFRECIGVEPQIIGEDLLQMLVERELRRDEEEPAFFYHGDHLGSAAYLTNRGQVIQALTYLPYGEDWYERDNFLPDDTTRLGIYRFNGKEKDYESGFHYYGARYYWGEVLTGWLSVDPLADKYPHISPYNYCMENPIKVIDPMGMDTINPSDPSKPESKQLSKACKSSYPGMIIVNGHGAVPNDFPSSPSTTIKFQNNRYSMDNGAVNMQGSNTIVGIAYFLKQYNGVYEENSRKGILTIVILVVCRAGTEFQVPENPQYNIAQTLSKEMPNAIIIAPSWDVTLKYKSKYDNMNVYKDPYRHVPGHWNVYQEGRKLDELPNYARLNGLVREAQKRAFVYSLLIP